MHPDPLVAALVALAGAEDLESVATLLTRATVEVAGAGRAAVVERANDGALPAMVLSEAGDTTTRTTWSAPLARGLTLEGGPDEPDADVLGALTTAGGAAVISTLRTAALRRDARTDPLCGVANRRGLLERLRTGLARTERAGEELSVLLLDVDGFKQINDVHGHTVGDAVLVTLAQLLLRVARAGDDVARLGGDEFVVVLPATSAGGAAAAAARVHDEARRLQPVPVHVSIGIATASTSEKPLALLERADAALYRDKVAGRLAVTLGSS